MVLARELSLPEIARIRDEAPPQLELEVFVHGAMCMSVSGRCLLSQYLAGRDGNRGQCAQPCRWKYSLVEEKRPGQYMEIGENEGGSYILSADDLCTAPFLDLIREAGVDSLKIEGRAKTAYYVASVTSAYKRALDALEKTGEEEEFRLPPDVLEELTRTSHRHYSPGFYFGPEHATQSPSRPGYIREWEFVGVVEEWALGRAFCTQRGKFTLGEELEALTPEGKMISFTPQWIQDGEDQPITSTPHAMMKFRIPTPEPLPPLTLLRRRLPQGGRAGLKGISNRHPESKSPGASALLAPGLFWVERVPPGPETGPAQRARPVFRRKRPGTPPLEILQKPLTSGERCGIFIT